MAAVVAFISKIVKSSFRGCSFKSRTMRDAQATTAERESEDRLPLLPRRWALDARLPRPVLRGRLPVQLISRRARSTRHQAHNQLAPGPGQNQGHACLDASNAEAGLKGTMTAVVSRALRPSLGR